MVLTTPFNNLLIKLIFKSWNIAIKGRSKIRVKKGANIFLKDHKSTLVLGFGDSTTASFKFSAFSLNLMRNSSFEINGKVIIGLNSAITIEKNAKLSIGDKTYIGAKVHIRVAKNITIGENVAIAWNVTIMDGDFHNYYIDEIKQNIQKDIVISDNVWIGNNTIILKGVKIGKNAIIGAGSVVTRDIPSGCIAAGNPIKIIKTGARPCH